MLCRHSSATPVLTLQLSGPSYLDAILTKNGTLLYAIETSGHLTSIYRDDPNYGLNEVATVDWSSDKWDVRVELAGVMRASSDTFLSKPTSSSWSRTFQIPGHPEPLKWKRSRHGYKCTTGAGHTLVASYTQSTSTLQLFLNSLAPSYPSSGSISASLLDHIVLTSLLLTTHPDEWQHADSASPSPIPSTAPLPFTSSPPSTPSSFSSQPDCTCSNCTFRPRSPSSISSFPSYHRRRSIPLTPH